MPVRTSVPVILTVVAAALLLTGCGDDAAPTADATPAPTVSVAAAPAASPTPSPTTACPDLVVGTTLRSSEFADCVSSAIDASSGYAATGTILGQPASVRHDPVRQSFEMTIPDGDVIGVGSAVWVRPTGGAWMPADTAASDPAVSALSDLGIQASAALPKLTTGAVMGDLTVTDVTDGSVTLSGADAAGDLSISGDYVVRPDYTLRSVAVSASTSEREVSIDLDVTEWDVPQQITAPR